MDTLTHIVLGACIGEALLGKQLGKKALWIGAIGQSIPDLDFVSSFWMDTASNLLAHRGFTHSLLFALLISFFLAITAAYFYKKHAVPAVSWMIFFLVETGTHIFLDAFNAYGVGWFEPFSSERLSFHMLFVADPFFSVWPFLAFLALLILKTTNRFRRYWWLTAISISAIYLVYCGYNKTRIDTSVKNILTEKKDQLYVLFVNPHAFKQLVMVCGGRR